MSCSSLIYRVVKTKIQHTMAHNFGIDVNKIYLTKPTFFSRMTNKPAKTIHDEYWHPHVDKVRLTTLFNLLITRELLFLVYRIKIKLCISGNIRIISLHIVAVLK